MASIINSTTTAGVTVTGDNSGSLQLATNNGTTAVTINTAQKVGIGTTPSGSYILEVNGNPNFNSVGGVYLTCGTYDVIKNPSGNIIAFGGVTSSQWDTTALYTGGTERMRITSDGDLALGTTTTGGSTPGKQIIYYAQNLRWGMYLNETTGTATAAYAIAFASNGTLVGTIQTTNSATSYVTSSDYRLKENIAPMTGALAKVQQLKPVTYTWKIDGKSSQGFIAHELQAVIPEAVSGEKDAVDTYIDKDGNEQTRIKPQGIDTSFVVATLTAAIQELKAELDATKAEVQALKGVA